MSVAPPSAARKVARVALPSPGRTRVRRRRTWGVLALVLVAAATLWQSSHRRGLGPAMGEAFLPANAAGAPTPRIDVAASPNTLKIGTFNIHGAKGLDRQRDLRRIAGELQGMDFVGLNEIHGPFLLEKHNQAQLLADQLGKSWLFAPAERRWWHWDYGNGALTSLPVDYWQRIPLPRAHGKGFRNLVLVRTRIGDSPLHVVLTHIDRSDDRERFAQLRFVADLFLALSPPAVLMGDLNSDANDPPMRRLLETPGVADTMTAVHGDDVPRQIDWIVVRGLNVRSAGINDPGPSDHPAVWAEVELPGH